MRNQDNSNLSSNRTNNEKAIIAFFLGAIIAACVSLFGLHLLADAIKELIVGFILVVIVLGGIFLFATLNKDWILEKLFGVSKNDLINIKANSIELIESIEKKDWGAIMNHSKLTIGKFSAWFSWWLYRRWVISVFSVLFLGFAGLFGSVLVYNQNKLITQQNEIIKNQNIRLDQQTYLQEAERRSSLVFFLSNVLDKIDEELKDQESKGELRKLSPQLTGRIVSLSRVLKPYYYLENDTMTKRPLSPERGQLLISLLESNLDSDTYFEIFSKGSFADADLKFADLLGANLNAVQLQRADLSGAYLERANLTSSNLSDANLSDVNLVFAKLNGANLFNSNLNDTNLFNADLSDSNLSGASFKNSNLVNANFSDARFYQPSFLIESGYPLELPDLTNCRVDDKNWFDSIKNNKAFDIDKVLGKFYIDTINVEGENGLYFYRIKKY